MATRFCIPLSRLPLDPEISGPTPFSSSQIPPSRGRLGRHTETTMNVPLDRLWSPSPPYPLSCRSEPRYLRHFPWPSGPPTGPVTIPPSLRLYASHWRTRVPQDQFPHCPILAQAVATERVSERHRFGPWGPSLKERRDITELIKSASTGAGPPDRARTTPTLCHAVQGRILCDVFQDCHDHRQGQSPYPPPRVCKLATWARQRKEVHHTDTLCFCRRTGCPFQHKVAPRPPPPSPQQ